MLLDDDDEEEYTEDDISVIDADNILNKPMSDEHGKNLRRDELKNYIMEKYY